MADTADALPPPTWATTFNAGLAEVPASFNRRRAMKLADKAGYPYVAFCGHVYASDEDSIEDGALAKVEFLGSARDSALHDLDFLVRIRDLMEAILHDEGMDERAVEAESLTLGGYVDALLDNLKGEEEAPAE